MAASPGNSGSAHFIVGRGASACTLRLDDVAPGSTKLVTVERSALCLKLIQKGLRLLHSRFSSLACTMSSSITP
jgi:hypothetical protein